MNWILSLSWLWLSLLAALVFSAVCTLLAALICRMAKKRLRGGLAALIAVGAFIAACIAIILMSAAPAAISA